MSTSTSAQALPEGMTADDVSIAVSSLAKWGRVRFCRLDRDDISSAAGLLVARALSKYDPSRGVPPGAWLCWYGKLMMGKELSSDLRFRASTMLDSELPASDPSSPVNKIATEHPDTEPLAEILACPLLTRFQRTALYLRHRDGVGLSDISRRYGRKMGWVNLEIKRAYTTLRTWLTQIDRAV